MAQLCACGCGEEVAPSPRTHKPVRYLRYHHKRKAPHPYIVDAETNCWVWQWSCFGNGYPQAHHKGRPYPAHRLYYEKRGGPIPEGFDLDHLCRNPKCVNPEHLEPVTRRENARRGALTKLTPDLVRAIRAASGTLAEVGERFGIDGSYVSRVRNRRVWADVD